MVNDLPRPLRPIFATAAYQVLQFLLGRQGSAPGLMRRAVKHPTTPTEETWINPAPPTTSLKIRRARLEELRREKNAGQGQFENAHWGLL